MIIITNINSGANSSVMACNFDGLVGASNLVVSKPFYNPLYATLATVRASTKNLTFSRILVTRFLIRSYLTRLTFGQLNQALCVCVTGNLNEHFAEISNPFQRANKHGAPMIDRKHGCAVPPSLSLAPSIAEQSMVPSYRYKQQEVAVAHCVMCSNTAW